MFVVATIWPINLGVMGFVAAFLVGTLLGGLSAEGTFSGFPIELFVLLTGVTLLFVIAQNNGTTDLITDWSVSLVRGNLGLMPWIMFALTTLLCSVGALSAADRCPDCAAIRCSIQNQPLDDGCNGRPRGDRRLLLTDQSFRSDH